ncbi:MAG: RNA polymerase sigma factor [Polyangiaceae bacterium]|nr:RNA polymerase sigma factor [Polyangiaceae bacterium]
MAQLDDRALMENLAKGDRRALRVLYERHVEFVYRVACRFAGNEEDARDITQSVFVAIMQSAHRFRPDAKLTTWIHRVVVNRCLNHRAKASRRLRARLTDRDFEEIPAADQDRPDRVVDGAERVARLQAAIRALPERQRVALLLSHFEGQSYDEIASILGCSKKSVESLLVRARRTLARSLSE